MDIIYTVKKFPSNYFYENKTNRQGKFLRTF